MKKLLFFFSLIAATGCTNAEPPKQQQQAAQEQAAQQQPAPKRDEKKYLASIQHLPPFRILSADSAFVTPANLKKGKPVMIVYFSPDCSHCQKMMYEFKPKMAAFKDIQVVMVTFSMNYDIRGIREFRRDYDLRKYPNFILGTEGYTMLVQRYYDIKTTPFIAIYDKSGNLSTYFEKVTKPEVIISAVKKVS